MTLTLVLPFQANRLQPDESFCFWQKFVPQLAQFKSNNKPHLDNEWSRLKQDLSLTSAEIRM